MNLYDPQAPRGGYQPWACRICHVNGEGHASFAEHLAEFHGPLVIGEAEMEAMRDGLTADMEWGA